MPRLMDFYYHIKFSRCKSDPNVFLNLIHGSIIIIFLYVDDLLMTRSSMKEISSLKDALNHAFSMTDLGPLSRFFELEISQSAFRIKVHQYIYDLYLLKKLNMELESIKNNPYHSFVRKIFVRKISTLVLDHKHLTIIFIITFLSITTI